MHLPFDYHPVCPQREKLIHELEEERRLRLESEKRLREVTEESELGRAQMVSLQQQFSRYDPTGNNNNNTKSSN